MRLRALVPVVSVLVALLAGAAVATPAGADSGPDVSRYQHPTGDPIDWARVAAAGQDFAFVKATEGGDVSNAWFARDRSAARAAGLYVGAYHFARPSTASGSAAAQARRFAAVIGDQSAPGTLPPALDLETSGGLSRAQLTSWVRSFLTTLEAATGRRPILYTYPSFWSSAMGGSSAFAQYPLWIAHYTSAAQPSHTGWTDWTFWQYSSTSRVSGIAGDVDMNRFAGSSADLARLALAVPVVGSDDDVPSGLSPASLPDTAPSRYTPLTPSRVVDTRTGTGAPRGRVTGPLTVQLPSSVPTDAAGVVLNVSALDATAEGYLRTARAGATPLTTVLSYGKGHAATGLVVARADGDRRLTLDPRGGAPRLVVDLVGYYDVAPGTGGHWVPLTPVRFVDSRTGIGTARGAKVGDVTVRVPGAVPAAARGVVLNVSVVDPVHDTFVRVGPTGTTPVTTALNVPGHTSHTGLVLATTAPDGGVTLAVHGGPAQVVVDLVGYYDADAGTGSDYVGTAPARLLDTRTGGGGRVLDVALPGSVPQGVSAVVLNVSTVRPTGAGFLRVAPRGEQATTTVLSYARGASQTGLVLARVGADRRLVATLNGGAADVVVDLVGYQGAGAPAQAPAPAQPANG